MSSVDCTQNGLYNLKQYYDHYKILNDTIAYLIYVLNENLHYT